jgi:hypothetical protein
VVSHHLVSQLVLFALIWLFILLYLTQSKRPVTVPATATRTAPAREALGRVPLGVLTLVRALLHRTYPRVQAGWPRYR